MRAEAAGVRYSLKELIKVELPVEMHVKLSVTLTDRLGPEILTVLEIKGQVLHGVRLHVKVPGWLLNLNALLTKKLPKFLSRLNEMSGVRGNMCLVSRSLRRTLKFILKNVIYCITCALRKKIYISKTGRRLADRPREHLRDAEENNTDASKPVARHFNLPNHSHHNMTTCGLFLHHGNTESRKNLKQKFIFQLGTLSRHGINERLSFH